MAASWAPPEPADTGLRGHIRGWLASWDFDGNPFELWEAGREPRLDRYFIRMPFFEQLLNVPQSTLVFASRGGGKSATRIMVEAECRPSSPTSSVFAVSFTDFSPFTEAYYQVPRLTLEDYVPYLIETSLPRVLAAIVRTPLLTIDFDSAQLGELRYWLDRCAPHTLSAQVLGDLLHQAVHELDDEWSDVLVATIQRGSTLPAGLGERLTAVAHFLSTLASAQPVLPRSSMSSPSRTMRAFVQLVLELLGQGSASGQVFYLLVDGIDEYALTQNDPQASADVMRPLLGNTRFLEIPGFVVKFFLPSEQRSALERVARMDRLEVIPLTWELSQTTDEPNHLRLLLRRRIAAFNTRGLVGLGELCAPAMRRWIEDAMLEEARGSPRNLMRLGDLLFAEHCQDLPEPESVLLPVEWERALTRFRATALREVQPGGVPLISGTAPATVPVPPVIPRLRVDLQSGQVFRGVEELSSLSDLEYRLLACLYRRRGQICTKDEIALEVYEPKYGGIGVSDQTISRLVYRLRQRIELPDQEEPVYLETLKGRGYRLNNTG